MKLKSQAGFRPFQGIQPVWRWKMNAERSFWHNTPSVFFFVFFSQLKDYKTGVILFGPPKQTNSLKELKFYKYIKIQ